MQRETRILLGVAAACGALFCALLGLAYGWGPARSLDLTGLEGFMSLNQGAVERAVWAFTQLGDPRQVAIAGLALASLALARGRPRVAVLVLVLIAATSVSGQLLKDALAHPRPQPQDYGQGLGPEAFPSGHATAVMSLALALVLAAPRRARPAAALLGSLLALGTGASVVANGGHYPSDVLGGFLLAAGWALVLVAALRAAESLRPDTGRLARSGFARLSEAVAGRGVVVVALAGAAGALLALLAVVAADPSGAASFARDDTRSLVIGAGVALAAALLPAGLAGLSRHA